MTYTELKDKTVVITAAGNGIGKASALEFARHGANVVVNDLDAELAEATAAAITSEGGSALVVIGDVTDFDQVKNVIDTAVEKYGSLDVLFNVAGGAMPAPFISAPLEDDRQIIAVNLMSVIYGTKVALPIMVEQGGGVILSTSSGAGLGAVNGLATYGAAKAGLQALMRSIAAEYGKQGIRANTISPGAMDTPGLRQWTETLEGGFEGFNSRQPSGRCGTAEEIAKAAVFMASDGASFINGTTLPVDGAVHAILAAPI